MTSGFVFSMFMLGLGTSLHCVSMCGPLVLTYAVKGEEDGPWYKKLVPNVAYQGAKVVSYMLVGLLLGAIGGFFDLDAIRPYVYFLAGAFMIVLGLGMTGRFPWAARLTPSPPKALITALSRLRRKSVADAKEGHSSLSTPITFGLMTGLLPCGPLMAAQVAAAASGSAVSGALGMAAFAVGTAPLMVALWVRFVQKQPVKSRLWLGLACALGGLALVAQFWKGMTLDPVGLISALGAGAALASYYLMGEHGQRERDPISLMGFSFGFSAMLWAIVSPWPAFPFTRLPRAVDLPGILPGSVPLWLLVLWIIVLGTVAPFLLVLFAVARLGPARVGLIGMLEPVGAGIIAWILLGESLRAIQIVGTVIVLVGIVLAETARQAATEAVAAHPGRRVEVAGIVTHRQRPATASGITFINLEDETGLVNVICSVGVWQRYRRITREAPAMIVRGMLERSPEGVTNLLADRFEILPLVAKTSSRDFR